MRLRELPLLIQDLPRRIGYIYGPRLMSRLRKRWVLLRNPHATISFTEPVYLGPGFSLHMPDGGTFIAGPGTEFRRNFRAEILADAVLTIGANCGWSYDGLIQCGGSISIGDHCMFGQSTMVVDGNHNFRDLERPMLTQGFEINPVVIEDDVTLMTKTTVIGTTVGKRAVIGANSVVTRPVPAYTVVGGVPAKPISYFGPEELRPPELSAERSETSG